MVKPEEYILLLIEINNGNIDLIKQTLYTGINFGHKHDSLTCVAALNGNLDIIKYLHNNGTNIYSNYMVFIYAAKNGDLNTIKYLHENRTNTTDELSPNINVGYELALWWAATRGHLDIVKYLHMNEVRILVPEFREKERYHPYKVRKVKCNLGPYTGDALQTSCAHGHLDIVKYLSSYSTDDCKVKGLFQAIKNGHTNIVKYLFENFPDTLISKKMLIYAVKFGFIDIVEFLVHKMINRSDITNVSKSDIINKILKTAIRKGHLDIVKFLHVNGADIGPGSYALQVACKANKTEIVKYLLKNDAVINLKGNDDSDVDDDTNTNANTDLFYFREVDTCSKGKHFVLFDCRPKDGICGYMMLDTLLPDIQYELRQSLDKICRTKKAIISTD